MKVKILLKSTFLMLVAASFMACSDSDKDVDNQLYYSNSNSYAPSHLSEVLFKSTAKTDSRILKVSMPKPENRDINIEYVVDESLVGQFNKAYYEDAIILTKEHYDIPEAKDIIVASTVESIGKTINFKLLGELDTEKVYVLPVCIQSQDLGILDSSRVQYFVFKGAALINVVPSMVKNYFYSQNAFPKGEVLENLQNAITMECLVNANSFLNEGKSFISTVMGIEGHFLLRFGDAGFPQGQLQVATSAGNAPDANDAFQIPTKQWVHLAVTYSKPGNAIKVYINGDLQSSTIKNIASINLNRTGIDGFQIGRSYEDSRYFDGLMSEIRIWNIERTQDEIKNNFYGVDPETSGLVAYWKGDEGEGTLLHDYANGNNLQSPAKDGVTWVKVSLPK